MKAKEVAALAGSFLLGVAAGLAVCMVRPWEREDVTCGFKEPESDDDDSFDSGYERTYHAI